MAQIGAGIGRSMSPVAGAGIIIAGLAGINPMEMAKISQWKPEATTNNIAPRLLENILALLNNPDFMLSAVTLAGSFAISGVNHHV